MKNVPATRAERILKFRANLNSLYIPIYDFLSENLPEEWAPYQGFRSMKEQEALFNQGRFGNPGPKVTYSRAGDSAHNYGCASDWVIWIHHQPIWNPPHSEMKLYQEMIYKAGGAWGGDFQGFSDDDHNQLALKVAWVEIGNYYRAEGIDAALDYLQLNKA